MAPPTVQHRIGIVVVACTLIATFYSVNELHQLSAYHTEADNDNKQFVTTDQTTSSSQARIAAVENAARPPPSSQKISSPPPLPPPVQASPPPPFPPPPLAAKPAQAAAATAHPVKERQCFQYNNTELWGDVVGWGTEIKAYTAAECCNLCRSHKPKTAQDPECDVWVWCGNEAKCGSALHQCWLKHEPHPDAAKPAKQGPEVSWTSGTMDIDLNADPMKAKKGTAGSGSDAHLDRKFHIATSAQGSAVHWQIRVHYYWYLKMKKQCESEGPCDMGGFTRILHSGKADDLVDSIPTVVVDPLPSSMVEHSWYIVLNRPYAFVQWVEKVKIPERYVLMSEPDHVFLRPLPNFMTGEAPAAFPFFYIEPAKAANKHITERFTGPMTQKELEKIAPIGNSPTYMAFEDMKRVMPLWMNISIAVFKDQEANKVWGWVQEMYGFTIALYNAGITHVDLFLHMMAQPPWDHKMEMAHEKPYYILHYTYGMDYKFTGEFTPGKYGEWRWDKRTYGQRPPPRHLGMPPEKMTNLLTRRLIESINEASSAIPCWDEYAETGLVTNTCGEPAMTI